MTSTRPSTEGSFATSLFELQRLEQERVRRLVDAKERRRAEEDLAKRDAERRADEAWRAHQRREHEESARVAAASAAIVERARIEAGARADEEVREAEHRRAMSLVAARNEEAHRRLGRVVVVQWAAIAALLVAAVTGAAVLAHRDELRAGAVRTAMDERDRRIDALRGDARARDEAAARLEARAHAAEARAASAEADLVAARRELEKAPRPKHGPASVPKARTDAVDGFGVRCPPGSLDPLCGAIGH